MQKVQIGTATLYQGDCMDLMKILDDDAFELAQTDMFPANDEKKQVEQASLY